MTVAYPKYRPSDVPWIDRVPVDWHTVPLFAVLEQSKVKNTGLVESNLLSLSFGRIVRKDIEAVGGLLPESFETYQIVEPDYLVFRFTDLQNDQRSLRSARVVERGIITSAYAAAKPIGIDARFAAYLMRSYDTSKVFYGLGGGVRQSLKFADVARLPVLVPASPEQRAIADYLDRETARIDTLIEEQQRLVEMLHERRASVISSALTPPAAWTRRRIKHIGETSLGKMLDAGRAVRTGDELRPYVRAADVRAGGSVNLMDLNEMPFSDAEMETFDLRAGDVLLIEGGATVGRPGYVFAAAPGVAFQKTVNRLRVDRQTDSRFVYWSMVRLYEASYYANHYGAVSFVHLTGEKLKEIDLDLPVLSEQRRIAAYLDEQTVRIDELIAESQRFIALASERRSALITAAVTGQIDVREVA